MKKIIIEHKLNGRAIKFVSFILFALFQMKGYESIAQATTTWVSIGSTSWTSSGNWSNGVPTKSKHVVIPSNGGIYPSISATSPECRNLTFTGSGRLNFTGSGMLNVYGDLTNSSSPQDNTVIGNGTIGTIKFKGDGGGSGVNLDAIITDTFYINKVIVEKLNTTNRVSLANNSRLYVRYSLTLKVGDFDARQGHARLIMDATDAGSNSWKTAYIDSIGSGHILGKVTCRQLVFQDYKTYHYLCSPVIDTNQTYWSTSMLEPFTDQTDVYNSYTYPGGTIPDFVYYDESVADPGASGSAAEERYGWKGVNPLTSNSGRVAQAQGVCARFAPYSSGGVFVPIEWTGIVNEGNLSTPTITYTNNSEDPDGLNFLGNPYPAPISWQAVYDDPDNSNNDFPVMGMFTSDGSEYTGTIQIWDAAVPSNSVLNDPIVAIGQGFFIRATNSSTSTFTWKDSHRVAGVDPTFWRKAPVQNALDIKLGGLNNRDITLIHFGDYNTTDRLPIKNAPKFMNPQNSVYTINGDDFNTALNLPFPTTETMIPIGIKIDENGSYFFEAANVNLPQNLYKAFLEDKLTKKLTEITPDFHYDFHATKGSYEDRFIIRVINKEAVDESNNQSIQSAEYAIINNEQLIFQLPGLMSQPVNANIIDSNGKSIWQGQVNVQNGRGTIDKYNLPQGLVLLNINNGTKSSNFKIANTN